MKIEFLPEALDYFNELSAILCEKKYFGFKESALKYVDELFEDISMNLAKRQKKPAPHYFDRYGKGMFYTTFKKSKNTQWYVFFTTYQRNGELIFLVRYISNNHVISKFL